MHVRGVGIGASFPYTLLVPLVPEEQKVEVQWKFGLELEQYLTTVAPTTTSPTPNPSTTQKPKQLID